MSEDLERLSLDLMHDERLYSELNAIGDDAADVDRWLQERSYRLQGDEVAALVSALGHELSDEELDAVSGGTGPSLQTSIDRRSHVLSTLSNIMGSSHDTADTMIDNLK